MKKILTLSLFILFVHISCAWSATPGYDTQTGDIILPSDLEENNYGYILQQQRNDLAEIEAAEEEYRQMQEAKEEAESIQLWERLDRAIKLRKYDEMVMDMENEFNSAKRAANPFLGEQGYVIFPYGEVVPIITCRPLRMTDVALEPGEEIMGIHAGDTVRWQFSPSQSMKNGLTVSHIVVKPSQPGISTNLLVHTDRRTYNLDFTSSEKTEYLRGVAFSYSDNNLTQLFTRNNKREKSLEDEIQSKTSNFNIDDMYTKYDIVNKSKVDWCPEAVFDDGNKTYIRMPSRFSETPALYIILAKKETLTNFRIKGRYYIVDRLFDKAYMRVGNQRVALVRKEKLVESNIKASKEDNRVRSLAK